jgi:hypothetical protein
MSATSKIEWTDLDNYDPPIGPHVHLCPQCFDDVPCEMDCSALEGQRTNDGLPCAHPLVCERCEKLAEGIFTMGAGI